MQAGRRRFITLTAAAGAALMVGRAGAASPGFQWRGNALGADASLQLYGVSERTGRNLVVECLAEVERLEAVFSLYRQDSSLSRLNREGRLDDAPMELVELLSLSRRCSEVSGGAFDVTIQPLWALYADHFSKPGADPKGPSEEAVVQARRLVDWRGVAIDAGRVSLARPGMAVTLNSVGQGYVTDKVAELLRRRGMGHVLVDMGEINCIGTRPDGSPWQVALEQGGSLPVSDRAVATSSPEGTRFSPYCHHIFDPRTGRSSTAAAPVSVVAGTATRANAVSTAICAGGGGLAKAMITWMPDARIYRRA